MTIKKILNQKGLTLVEALAVLLLTTIVSLIIFSVLTSGKLNYNKQHNINNDLRDISVALNEITRDFRQAETIFVDEVQNILTVGTFSYRLDPDEDVLKKFTNSGEVKSQYYNIDSFRVNKLTGNCFEIDIQAVNGKSVNTKICERN